jgi:hypothetical protein
MNWFKRHKVISVIIALFLIVGIANAANSSKKTSSPSQPSTSDSTTTNPSATSNASQPTQSSQQATTAQPSTPALRQDLAFQGDADYCDGIYKDNGNGTTTWTLQIKQPGEIITHLSDKNGKLYRHDEQVKVGYYAYTAPVAINDVSEINGVLTVGSVNHPCNIAPQQ